jgi:uncharacterized protein (TIGR02246 family)
MTSLCINFVIDKFTTFQPLAVMKSINLTLAAVFFLTMNAVSQLNNPEMNHSTSMETQQIAQSILSTLENAWNSANGAEFAKPFADISEFVDIRGTYHQNAIPQYVGEAHQGMFMSIYKDSKVDYKLIQSVPIDQNTILVHASAELNAPSGPLAGISESMISMVLAGAEGNWKIRAFHNTLVRK